MPWPRLPLLLLDGGIAVTRRIMILRERFRRLRVRRLRLARCSPLRHGGPRSCAAARLCVPRGRRFRSFLVTSLGAAMGQLGKRPGRNRARRRGVPIAACSILTLTARLGAFLRSGRGSVRLRVSEPHPPRYRRRGLLPGVRVGRRRRRARVRSLRGRDRRPYLRSHRRPMVTPSPLRRAARACRPAPAPAPLRG
jgi:hypothetical protein